MGAGQHKPHLRTLLAGGCEDAVVTRLVNQLFDEALATKQAAILSCTMAGI
jgi:hypothetical protein